MELQKRWKWKPKIIDRTTLSTKLRTTDTNFLGKQEKPPRSNQEYGRAKRIKRQKDEINLWIDFASLCYDHT